MNEGVQSPVFVGRRDELASLVALLRQARQGEPGFAMTYALSAEARAGLVAVTLGANSQVSAPADPVTFTAAVAVFGGDQEQGHGTVQFLFDGERTERPVELDKFGRATLMMRKITCIFSQSSHFRSALRDSIVLHLARPRRDISFTDLRSIQPQEDR